MADARATTEEVRFKARAIDRAIAGTAALAPLLMRLTIGTVMLVHGVAKWANFGAAASGMEAMGFSPGGFWALVGGIIETLGGAGLLLGFFTRWCAFVIFCEQLVAMLLVHLPNGFFLASQPGQGGNGIEYSLVNLGVLSALFILGSGPIGIDPAIRRRKRLETHRVAKPPPAVTQGK